MKKTKSPKVIPYEFALEALDGLSPYMKPMFGAYGVYVQDKIVFILRHRPSSTVDNGVWLATSGPHHASLQKEFPNMRSIDMFGPGPTGWQVLPEDAEDFEESVLRACEFIHQADVRIGKVPKTKLKKKVAKKSSGKKSARKRI